MSPVFAAPSGLEPDAYDPPTVNFARDVVDSSPLGQIALLALGADTLLVAECALHLPLRERLHHAVGRRIARRIGRSPETVKSMRRRLAREEVRAVHRDARHDPGVTR